jgi:hypothetical protein
VFVVGMLIGVVVIVVVLAVVLSVPRLLGAVLSVPWWGSGTALLPPLPARADLPTGACSSWLGVRSRKKGWQWPAAR